MTKARKPKFEVGDKVALWGRDGAGTVVRHWFDTHAEMVRVKWASGFETDERAYRLQHAA